MMIPFNRDYHTGRESEYVIDAASNLSQRVFAEKCRAWIGNKFSDSKIIMTSSATAAIELALMSLELKFGDEVIIPSFAYPSIANAILLARGKPVFSEIDPKTLSLSPEDLEKRITSRTKAVLVVHYGGTSHHLNEIQSLCSSKKICLIEDASHAFLARHDRKPLGSVGDFGIFSFHHTKNISAGNGGALLINRPENTILYKRCRMISENGTNRLDFLDGRGDNYDWQCHGLNSSPSELAMAYLYAQLEKSDSITASRNAPYAAYHAFFDSLPDPQPVIRTFSPLPADGASNYHTFYLCTRTPSQRQELRHRLLKMGVMAVSHFEPLHSAPMGFSLGYSPSDLPETLLAAKTVLRLPLFNYMAEEEYRSVIAALSVSLEEMAS